MSERTAHHHTFNISRRFDHPPSRVFFAFSNAEARAAWFRGPPEWDQLPPRLDFSVGGEEISIGGPKGGPLIAYESRFLEIVPEERIVHAFRMVVGETVITASLATTELRADGDGTNLTLTEQIVFLDGSDHLDGRIEGTEAVIDSLETWLNTHN